MRVVMCVVGLFTGLFIGLTVEAEELLRSCSPQRSISLQELTDIQTGLTFEAKFSLITPNIAQQSRNNLLALKRELETKRDLAKHEAEARALSTDFLKNNVLQHSTHHRKLKTILRTGALLSKDELIRKGILKASSKNQMTLALYDGTIGEQDVVYLAYQSRNPSESYGFGDVTFLFDIDPVIEQAYLTFNSFTVGAGVGEINSNTECNSEAFREMVRSYRSLVFDGRSYRELVSLSAANAVWISHQSQLHSFGDEAKTLLQDFRNLESNAIQIANENQSSYRAPEFPGRAQEVVCGALPLLNQSQRNCERASKISTSLISNALSTLSIASKNTHVGDRVLRSFAMFPLYDRKNSSSLFRQTHWFWEVKVPRRLEFDHLQAIVIPTNTTTYSNGAKPQTEQLDITDDINAIEEFARSHGWKVQKTQLAAGRLKFTFLK